MLTSLVYSYLLLEIGFVIFSTMYLEQCIGAPLGSRGRIVFRENVVVERMLRLSLVNLGTFLRQELR